MIRFLSVLVFTLHALFAPALALAGDKVRMSVAASDSYTTSYSCEAAAGNTGTDSEAQDLQTQAYLLRLEGTATSIVTAASVTWYLAKDSAGEKPITDEATATILDADADGSGGVVSLVNTGWILDDDSTAGTIYVCGKTDAGTLTIVNRLFWEAR